MQTLRTILVDDEPRGINSLQKLLELNCPDVEIIASCSNAEEAFEKIGTLDPDLLFLDIAMPVKNGLQMLEELKDFRFEVILVTAYNQFMIEAFHFSAVDYLLKPVDEDLLIDAVRRAKKRVVEKTGNKNIEAFLHNIRQNQTPHCMRLCIPSLKGFQVVDLSEILYAEALGSYTNFFFRDRHSICTSKSIHDYEGLLSDSGFVRIHKSYLVNLLHVKEYLRGEGGAVILSNNQELEVARRKKDQFMEKMKRFYKY